MRRGIQCLFIEVFKNYMSICQLYQHHSIYITITFIIITVTGIDLLLMRLILKNIVDYIKYNNILYNILLIYSINYDKNIYFLM